MSFLKNKLLTLFVALGMTLTFTKARYSKINLKDTMSDYGESFKTKHFDFELEADDSDDLLASPMVQEQEPIEIVQHSHPKVGQVDEYDGYIKPKEPFSKTDGYQYALQFKIGAKLDNNYDYVDECFDAWILIFDDVAYYQNNVTYTK